MKWNLLFSGLLAGSFLCASPLAAQESATAAAEREEMEVNFRRMKSNVEQLQETLQTQQKRMADMVAEIHSLRERVDRLKAKGESTATQESIKQLAEKIEEVDKKRLADNESITRKLAGLGKELSTTLTQKIATPPPAVKPDTAPAADRACRRKSFSIRSGRGYIVPHRHGSPGAGLENHAEAGDGHQSEGELGEAAHRADGLHPAAGEVGDRSGHAGNRFRAVRSSKQGFPSESLPDPPARSAVKVALSGSKECPCPLVQSFSPTTSRTGHSSITCGIVNNFLPYLVVLRLSDREASSSLWVVCI